MLCALSDACALAEHIVASHKKDPDPSPYASTYVRSLVVLVESLDGIAGAAMAISEEWQHERNKRRARKN